MKKTGPNADSEECQGISGNLYSDFGSREAPSIVPKGPTGSPTKLRKGSLGSNKQYIHHTSPQTILNHKFNGLKSFIHSSISC